MAELKVVAPESDFSGVVAGVVFTNGEAKTDNSSALRYFREAGYGVDGSTPVRAGSAGPEESEGGGSEESPAKTPKPAKKAASKRPAKKAASKPAKKAAAAAPAAPEPKADPSAEAPVE